MPISKREFGGIEPKTVNKFKTGRKIPRKEGLLDKIDDVMEIRGEDT